MAQRDLPDPYLPQPSLDILKDNWSPALTISKVLRMRCEVCGRQFSRADNLARHMHIHTGEKPYRCVECSRQFSRRDHLKTHMLTHMGEKPYKCEECSRQFSQHSGLQKHLLTHTGEKPYRCEKCSKQFRQLIHLKTHMRTHTGRTGRGHSRTRHDTSFTPGLVREVRRAKLNSYKCEYQRRCARFRDELGLQDNLFFPERDMCYCPSCHERRGDIEIYQRGNPPKPYVLPLGWSRFALQVPLPQVKLPRGGTVAAFDRWHICFHGTLRDNIKPILETGGLRRPGDDIFSGS
ncbi:zinc finger protein 233-like [Branchiostoma floridae]|uniref:Zinc finger protein 233-like n=1 Tax=Branchiostoma floridae TaxID=7739 RepID=A0A9J7HMF7_BRAFL|nr:zinc finger protein 233-like [Branchiostoma floridae]